MGYFQMTRNVEELFGGVVTAPHQIPFTYKSNVGGETFLSLPFYPVTGVVTINGGMQVPLDNFEIEGNTLNLGRALSKGDVVYCLFDKILSPEDTAKGIRIYKFQAVGGETEFTPDFTSYGVQSLYIGGEYKTPEIEYSYDSTTGKVSLQTALTAGVWVVAEMSVKQPNISPAFDRSIQEIARSANVKDSEVIVSTDTISLLDGKKVVYDIATQTSYGLPTIPDGSVISSVSAGKLNYNPGDVQVDLLPLEDSFINVINTLGRNDGAKYIGECHSVADLRNTEPTMDGQRIILKQHTAGTLLGGGVFRALIDGTGKTDNNGTVIKTVGGAAWLRVNADRVNPFMFGALGGSNDDTIPVQSCVDSGKATQLTDAHYVSNIQLKYNTSSIYGSGLHYSRLHQLPSATGNCITIKDTCSLIVLDAFGVYGTGAQQGTSFTAGTTGIYVETPSGLSADYPFHTTADPRRDLCISKVHIAGFDEYGLNIDSGNFSVTTDSLLVNHINQVGVRCATTDWTWTNIQVNTCGKQCLVLDGCGNGRIIGGKFIWANWQPYGTVGQFPGITINNSQNMVINGIEVQDCGGNGIEISDSYSISMNGLNTNRNGINANNTFYNIVFNKSDAVINGFVGLNYAANSGSGANSSAGNFQFLSNDCSVTINGVVETGYMGINFIGDNNIINPTNSDLSINGLVNYSKTGLQTMNETPTFDGVSTTPVYVSVPSSVGQVNGLRLSQANKDKLLYSRTAGPEGITMAAVVVPTISGAEVFNFMAIGSGFSDTSNSLHLQLVIDASGKQTIALLLGGDGTTQILSGDLPNDLKLQSGVPYHIAIGAKPGYFWWSILNIQTGKRIRRSFRGAYLAVPFNSIFGLTSPLTFFSDSNAGGDACSGVGAKVYVGMFSSENDYVASRYYNLINPVDPTKLISYRILDSSI
ncbi:tail fiber protein [Salmonella phage rabagast]|uniref:Tail fiber protein n=2 Tax=Kuttervirus TaxID=2169536 RepID=A0A6G9LAM3_9CAUD|nr:tail fiber protein [Salmonella phage rabagast]QIQ61684.1 tail fiber protein [Salmonella phage rabagast]